MSIEENEVEEELEVVAGFEDELMEGTTTLPLEEQAAPRAAGQESPDARDDDGAASEPPSQCDDGASDVSEVVAPWARCLYNAEVVNDEVFEELSLHPELAREAQGAWANFLRAAESTEAAAEAVYAAVFDVAPSLQALFKTPRAVFSIKFLGGIGTLIGNLHDPKALKRCVETLAFQHLDIEVTEPRIVLFREAIADLLVADLGELCTAAALDGIRTVMNYVGGAFIFIRHKYADRLRILASSWHAATSQPSAPRSAAVDAASAAMMSGGADSRSLCGGSPPSSPRGKKGKKAAKAGSPRSGGTSPRSPRGGGTSPRSHESHRRGGGERRIDVPTTFEDMFRFNATVMGFSGQPWMNCILGSFDAIVRNVANSYRLQEECDLLAMRMSRMGRVDLSDFKAVMLASLRSLVPEAWDPEHEVAWSWLWENVERLLKAQMGKPAPLEKALSKLFSGLDDQDKHIVRTEVYARFFELAPAGMAYFKQSTTRLHFIADKAVAMTLELYKHTDRMVADLNALGLRHVGYGIPIELFGPFVCACVDVVRKITTDDLPLEAFRWSLSLISRILTRVITEGSTIVMRAINANSGKQIEKAVACAPRSERADWVLRIAVGSQSISPLLWALETGSLNAAEAIIQDLLAIRADRDRYYCGVDALFTRHPDIVRILSLEAPALLPKLLDGLIWRSRFTEHGRRRVVHFAKHLIVTPKNEFAKAIEWIVDTRNPDLVCHPVTSQLIDLVWTRVAARAFLSHKSWLLVAVVACMLSQSILNSGPHEDSSPDLAVRAAVLVCRCFIYLLSLPQLVRRSAKHILKDCRAGDFAQLCCIKVPASLCDTTSLVALALSLALLVMLVLEPILWCLGSGAPALLFTERCDAGDATMEVYSFFSMCAMALYYVLLMDLTVCSNRVSAGALVFGRVVQEVLLFVAGFAFVLLIFASALSALKTDGELFETIPTAAFTLLRMFLGMASHEEYMRQAEYPVLFAAVVVFFFTTVVYMLNLLVAQLACAYSATFADMMGWARLRRGAVSVAAMSSVRRGRWLQFVESLRLDEPCQFAEGDVGMPGGISMSEPAHANVTTVDMIQRYGGSTSPSAAWPEDEHAQQTQGTEDRLVKVERLLRKIAKRVDSARRNTGNGGLPSSGQSSAISSGGANESFNSSSKSDAP